MLAATIGGASMGSYAALGATELDSHANMAVAGRNCTITATSGHYANITPFSSNLPTMDMVKIGDAAIAYDNPILHVISLLVMPNALMIPTMDHNLIPPFLLRGAGLYVDKTPKHQVANPTVDNHVIVDSETGMRIHLSLNGIFSSFLTHALTLEEIEDWDTYPIAFITPDSIAWDPYASHYAENKAACLTQMALLLTTTLGHHRSFLLRPIYASSMGSRSRRTSSTMPLIECMHPTMEILDAP